MFQEQRDRLHDDKEVCTRDERSGDRFYKSSPTHCSEFCIYFVGRGISRDFFRRRTAISRTELQGNLGSYVREMVMGENRGEKTNLGATTIQARGFEGSG